MNKLPDAEDYALVKESVVLPLVMTVFDRDAKLIAEAVKTPAPYVDLLTRALDRITADTVKLRQECRRRGIKIYEEIRTAERLTARYMCRGHNDVFVLLTATLRVEVEQRMRLYLGEDMTKYKRDDLPHMGPEHIGIDGLVH
jgi:hypothetical protein